MKVLIVIDEYGWAWDFHARGIKKYSNYNVEVKRMDELTEEDKGYDIYHFFGLYSYLGQVNHISEAIRNSIPSEKIICGIRSHARLEVPPKVNFLTCVSKELYELMKTKYPDKKIYLIRNAVDVDIFKPLDSNHNRFVVGWAGNPNSKRKRFDLIGELGFPFKIKADSGREFFVKNCSRQKMVDFYHEIDVLVNFSINEGMPTTILEASACGLPIVSTDVGGIPEFLSNDWLVPNCLNDLKLIQQFKEKLSLLMNDVDLRREVGKANFERILKGWTWNKRALEYDKLYEEVMKCSL